MFKKLDSFLGAGSKLTHVSGQIFEAQGRGEIQEPIQGPRLGYYWSLDIFASATLIKVSTPPGLKGRLSSDFEQRAAVPHSDHDVATKLFATRTPPRPEEPLEQ